MHHMQKSVLVDNATIVHFPSRPFFVFLSKQENESEAWKSLLADPTFTRTSTNRDFINIEQLQRLKPGSELNCDIINLYHWQCRSQQPNENKKTVVATYFWPQIILGKSGYNSATKFLFKALVSIFLYRCFG